MKTSVFRISSAVILGLAALTFAGCEQSDKVTPASSPPKARSERPTATSPASAPKALDSELMTPAEAPQPPAPPAPAEPLPSTAAVTAPESIPAPVPSINTRPPTVSEPAAPAAAAPLTATDAWEQIKDYTFAQKSELVEKVRSLTSTFDSDAALVRSSTAKPEFFADRSTAVTALEDARTVLAQKREILENASAETWQSAKAEFRATWKNALSAYEKAKLMSN